MTNQAGNVTAGQTAQVSFGAGAPFASSGAAFHAPLPAGFMVPVGAQVQIFDAGVVDNSDTIAVLASMAL
jgi:hypothetical protein